MKQTTPITDPADLTLATDIAWAIKREAWREAEILLRTADTEFEPIAVLRAAAVMLALTSTPTMLLQALEIHTQTTLADPDLKDTPR